MLQAYPTKGGTGVSIFGDYADLHALYSTANKIVESLDEREINQDGQQKLLANFKHEVKKAYSGQRLIETFTFDNQKPINYFGFQLVWTDILIFMSVLRYNAGFIRTDGLSHSVLYLLEHVVERALFNYDPVGASQIKEFIGQRINITDDYAFQLYQAVHLEMTTGKTGKTRFRNIPDLLGKYFSRISPEYKGLVASFEQSGRENGCHPTELEFNDFPKIKW